MLLTQKRLLLLIQDLLFEVHPIVLRYIYLKVDQVVVGLFVPEIVCWLPVYLQVVVRWHEAILVHQSLIHLGLRWDAVPVRSGVLVRH